MECQHCEKSFFSSSEFEAHTTWHTARQAKLQRLPRKYSTTNETTRSASTSTSSFVHGDGSVQCSPKSTTTTEAPSTGSKRHFVAKIPVTYIETNIPDFDFNFGITSPITLESNQPLIKSLDDVVARFPAFQVEDTEGSSPTNRDYECVDCEAVFSTQQDCDLHNQSRFCPGSAAVAFALYRDVSQLGGYRIDKKYLPFNATKASIKCEKCHLSFTNRISKKLHERCHPPPRIRCSHCRKAFSTDIELESHYQWHDDMEYRHHRARCRRKLPGLKLHTKDLPELTSRTGVADFGRKSVFLADEDLTATSESFNEDSGEQCNNLEPEKDIVAISFISPEDLERVHAPNGIFREVEPGYLSPREQVPEHHVADALHALEGRSTTSQESSIESSIRSPPSVKNPDLGHSLNSDDKAELTNLQSSDAKKRSSIRDLFRRTKSESQPESSKPGLQRRCTLRKPRRDTVAKENTTFDVRFMLSAMLQRVNVAANKGNLKAVRKECDDLMAMAPPSESDIESEKVPVQAFEFREGTLIQDTAGSLRYINSETVKAITSALRRTPIAHWAKIKVSILSTRAYLSTQEGDYNDAYWSYRQVSNTLRQHPMLFPDVIWHAVILTNLAHLSARLGRPDDEERYYLKALSISYKRYGRRDLNNINFLTALATAYEKNTQTKTAAELFKRSLFARIEISGPDDNDTLMAMQELAAINAKLGDLEVAKLLYERCLGGFEIQLGLEHKVTLLIVDRLCNTYLQLQAQDDALALYTRAFPYLCAVCDSDDELLRTWLSQYIQHTRNFGFPEQISAVLRKYRDNPTEKNVSVLQNLARIYMLGGLLADALELFELVFKARRRIQKHDPAALDALHGHCLALECMDKIDAAHTAYTNLVQLALQLPDGNDGKKRALNARIRLGALEERKKVLSHEKDAWQLDMPGPCGICHSATTLLCPKCQISRFCGEACRDLASGSHNPACHPSVTLCESKSVTATPSVPHRIERQVIERLSYQDLRNGVKATIYRVSNSFTISYDARNFTTFRVKLNSQRHTYLFFDRDADIRFAIIDPSAPAATAESESESDSRPHERTSNLQPRRATDEQQPLFKWTTPRETEPLLLRRGSETYLLVSPGRKLFQEHIAKRRAVRMQDSEHLERLDLPDAEMVEFCQGLVLEQSERQPVGFAGKNGRMGRRFAYLVEVE